MRLLDTNHLSVLADGTGSRYLNLTQRMEVATEPIQVPVVATEEQMRGWLAVIAKEKLSRRQVKPYLRLARLFQLFAEFTIVPFDDLAADQFDALRKQKIRIGTMDLKIAAIAMVNNANLLTANKSDFDQVPGLKHENWLD